MNEVNVVKAPERTRAPAPSAVTDVVSKPDYGMGTDISVPMNGRQLEITATVNAQGLKTLQAMLTQYEAILALMNNPKQ